MAATDTEDDLLDDSDLSSIGGSPSDHEIFTFLNKKSSSSHGTSSHTRSAASSHVETELLKEEMLTKDAFIEKLKNEHVVIVAQLEERCTELAHQCNITKLQAEKDLKQCELYFRQQQEKTQHELEILKTRLKNPILRDRLSAAKEDLSGTLSITEGTFIELKAKPVESLSLREFVLLRIYETEKASKTQREGLQKENEINGSRLIEAREGFARLNRDYELLARTTSERIQQLDDDLRIEKAKTTKLHKQLTEYPLKYVGKVEVLEVKGTTYDKLNGELQATQSELSRVTHDHITATHTLKVVQEDKTEVARKFTETSQTVELLRMDKIYLSKEVENLQYQIRKLEDQSERQQQKLRDVKKSREDLFQKLVKYKEEQKTTLANEVEKLREKTLQDLEAIKASAKEQADRELRSMRETRDNAVLEADRARAKLLEVRQAYDELQAEHRTVVASFEGKLAEMNSSMKMKVFEMERLALTKFDVDRYEETLNNLSQARVEIEKFRKKAELLTTEYYTLQTDSTKRISELSAKIDELSEKLMGFEGLEAELESAALSGDVSKRREKYQ